MKKIIVLLLCCIFCNQAVFGWGFYAHRKINELAVFLLPPEMLVLYKPHMGFLVEHAVDPDKRRYVITAEGPRHYIDIDHYGQYPYPDLPRKWKDAVSRYTEDSLNSFGIVPWWIQTMLQRLTTAFKEKNQARILKFSAELGHYIADSHVPLHACRNHNGQYTGQKGIHGLWESRIPELLAETEWDFFIGKAKYIPDPLKFAWSRVMESALAADSVLRLEKELTQKFPTDQKYAFEERNGVVIRQYSSLFTRAYDGVMQGMTERCMRQSVYAVASFWYTAWVNAGQPKLESLTATTFSEEDKKEFDLLNQAWKNAPDEH